MFHIQAKKIFYQGHGYEPKPERCKLHGDKNDTMVNFAPGFEPHFDGQEEVGGIGLCPELLRAMEGVKYIAEVTRIMEDSNKVN